ncbi:MAG: restriction endonuclease [Candidatus Saccharimonadales bacterium]
MARNSRAQSNDVSFVIVILVGAAAWTHRAQLVDMAYVALGVLGFLILAKLCWKLFRNRRSAGFRRVDNMDGLDFEKYIAKLLRKSGFTSVSLTERYDYGVDIIAEKNGIRWGVQVKRYTGLVKADAVRQVVTGLRLYHCERSMVITNSTYSSVARRLAASNDCVLIDRTGLAKLMRTCD